MRKRYLRITRRRKGRRFIKSFDILLSISATGAMTPADPPTPTVKQGDIVSWTITNNSGATLRVRIKDFNIKAANPPHGPAVPNVLRFAPDNATIPKSPIGLTGKIEGAVRFGPAASTLLKYTVGVNGPATIDHDPDLEVAPPGRKIKRIGRRKK